MTDRNSQEITFMQIASVLAERSTCRRRQVGAVLVRDNMIIATGHNGAPRGLEHCSDRGWCVRREMNVPSGEKHELCRAVHAEQNCIINAARTGVSTMGAHLFTQVSPCPICAKMIVNAGIKKVYFDEYYSDDSGLEILKEAGIELVVISEFVYKPKWLENGKVEET